MPATPCSPLAPQPSTYSVAPTVAGSLGLGAKGGSRMGARVAGALSSSSVASCPAAKSAGLYLGCTSVVSARLVSYAAAGSLSWAHCPMRICGRGRGGG